MRDDHQFFVERGVDILAIGPDKPGQFIRYWDNERIPYIGLPDPDHKVARLYRQQVILFKLGRMPLLSIVDQASRIRYVHYGTSMSDIPSNETLLDVIDQLKTAS